MIECSLSQKIETRGTKMKKTFQLTNEKIKYDRLVAGVRADVNKYLKRERKKPLTEGVDFWDFNCKFGANEAEAKIVHVGDLSKSIDEAEKLKLTSFYVEILAKPGHRTSKKPKAEEQMSPES